MPCPWTELFRSVELVWALWAAGLVGLFIMVRGMARCRPVRPLRELAGDESGAAYTLGYVITIPIFALLICLVVDMSLILTAKIGTVYAAFAAGRSAAVWVPSGIGDSAAREKARVAAAMAMTSFASGSQAHQPTAGGSPAWSDAMVTAHQQFAADPARDEYLRRKTRYADWATQVQITGGDRAGSDVNVTLDYRAPFHLPGIGLLLGAPATPGGPRTYNIRTVSALESHAPLGPNAKDDVPPSDPSRPLGISYVPDPN